MVFCRKKSVLIHCLIRFAVFVATPYQTRFAVRGEVLSVRPSAALSYLTHYGVAPTGIVVREEGRNMILQTNKNVNRRAGLEPVRLLLAG